MQTYFNLLGILMIINWLSVAELTGRCLYRGNSHVCLICTHACCCRVTSWFSCELCSHKLNLRVMLGEHSIIFIILRPEAGIIQPRIWICDTDEHAQMYWHDFDRFYPMLFQYLRYPLSFDETILFIVKGEERRESKGDSPWLVIRFFLL